MTPSLYIVSGHEGDWFVLYWVSNISDRKLYEGHDDGGGATLALAEALGVPVEHYEFTDEDEVDGCTPDTFKSIKGIKKL